MEKEGKTSDIKFLTAKKTEENEISLQVFSLQIGKNLSLRRLILK